MRVPKTSYMPLVSLNLIKIEGARNFGKNMEPGSMDPVPTTKDPSGFLCSNSIPKSTRYTQTHYYEIALVYTNYIKIFKSKLNINKFFYNNLLPICIVVKQSYVIGYVYL